MFSILLEQFILKEVQLVETVYWFSPYLKSVKVTSLRFFKCLVALNNLNFHILLFNLCSLGDESEKENVPRPRSKTFLRNVPGKQNLKTSKAKLRGKPGKYHPSLAFSP